MAIYIKHDHTLYCTHFNRRNKNLKHMSFGLVFILFCASSLHVPALALCSMYHYVVTLHLSSGLVWCLTSALFILYSQRFILRIKSEERSRAMQTVVTNDGKEHILVRARLDPGVKAS